MRNEAENALITLNAQKAEKEGDISDMAQAIRDTVGELEALDQTKVGRYVGGAGGSTARAPRGGG